MVGKIVSVYVTLMRCIPLILVLFWFFFLVPLVLGYLYAADRPISKQTDSQAALPTSVL